MSVVVFSGPTLSSGGVTFPHTAQVRPPARCGDVLRAALERPSAILLIDGYFDRVASVWHKEILFALTQGIHVFGASSMGALRAAELLPFGMVGIGRIFSAFQSGTLEDDDEVAVAHGDGSIGYRSLSEAMVNIRFTLENAEREGVISPSTHLLLVARAKATPYHERSFRALLREGTGASPEELAALREWLPMGRVDQKREDALAALAHITSVEQGGWLPKTVNFQLAETDGWVKLRREVEGALGAGFERELPAGIAAELVARGRYGRTALAATTRLLAVDRLRQAHVEFNARTVEATIDEFRRERGLTDEPSFDAWLAQTGLDAAALEQFFRRETAFRAIRAELGTRLGAAIDDELRSSGDLEELRASAALKTELLARHGAADPTLAQAQVTEGELWNWFFREHLQTALPDVVAFAAKEGMTVDQLRAAALRELVYFRLHRERHPTHGNTD